MLACMDSRQKTRQAWKYSLTGRRLERCTHLHRLVLRPRPAVDGVPEVLEQPPHITLAGKPPAAQPSARRGPGARSRVPAPSTQTAATSVTARELVAREAWRDDLYVRGWSPRPAGRLPKQALLLDRTRHPFQLSSRWRADQNRRQGADQLNRCQGDRVRVRIRVRIRVRFAGVTCGTTSPSAASRAGWRRACRRAAGRARSR